MFFNITLGNRDCHPRTVHLTRGVPPPGWTAVLAETEKVVEAGSYAEVMIMLQADLIILDPLKPARVVVTGTNGEEPALELSVVVNAKIWLW